MTSNQIAYWRNVETERSNRAQEAETYRSHRASEGETQRHNIMQEAIGIGNLRETERHNLMYESETRRHNVETEAISWGQLSETSRHNRATEDISYGQLYESQRHNLATEKLGYDQLYETRRHNTASESLAKYQADLNATTTLEKARMETAQSAANSVRALQGTMYGADFGYKAALLAHSDRIEEMNITRSQNMLSNAERERSNRAQEANVAQANRIQAYKVMGDLVVNHEKATYQGLGVLNDAVNNLTRLVK